MCVPGTWTIPVPGISRLMRAIEATRNGAIYFCSHAKVFARWVESPCCTSRNVVA